MVYYKQKIEKKFRKIVLWASLLSFSSGLVPVNAFAQLYTTKPFTVYWLGVHQENCTRLAKTFVQELETFLPDREVILSPQNNSDEILKEELEEKDSIFLKCDKKRIDTLGIEDPKNLRPSLDMRYLEKLEGFEHSSWLEFQKNYLRIAKDLHLEDLAPKHSSEKTELSAVQKSESVANSGETPFYQKWWFWTAIGVVAVGTGAYLIQKASAPSTVKVDLK